MIPGDEIEATGIGLSTRGEGCPTYTFSRSFCPVRQEWVAKGAEKKEVVRKNVQHYHISPACGLFML